MDSKAASIPLSEWERHKPEIVEIYQHKSLKDVRAEMKTKHGFDASPWQYQAQLRHWNIRKYATRNEWQQYHKFAASGNPSTHTMNDLPGDSTVPDIILQKSQRSKKRARRWASGDFARGGAQSVSEQPRSESTEIESHHIPVSSSNEPIVARESLQLGVTNAFLNLADILESRELSSVNGEPSTINEFNSNYIPWNNWPNVANTTNTFANESDFLQLSLPTELFPTPSDFQISSLQQNATDRLSLQPWCLPTEFNTFAGILEAMNIKHELPFAYLDFAWRGEQKATRSDASKNPLGGFALKVVNEILLSKVQSLAQQQSHMGKFLRQMGSQVPGENSALITSDQAFESNFSRALLYSVLNGFSGLDNVPMESILRFLNRFAVNKLLLEILEQCPRYVSRTIADNIFRAAIEAADTKVVSLLIDRRLVDVNETMCILNGYKYTPIERAAQLRFPLLMKALIKAGANVHKSHADPELNTSDGALGALLSGLNYLQHEVCTMPVPHEAFEAFNVLIDAGARVHPRMTYGKAEFDFLIFQNVRPEDHRGLFMEDNGRYEGPFQECVRDLDDSRASTLVRHVDSLCHQAGCGDCLVKFSAKLAITVVDAASSGKVELVKLLLDKSDLKSQLPRIFLAAIKSRRHAMIEFALSQDPVLDPPATKERLDPRTPFSEAVRYGNADLIQKLERVGCLDHLTEGGRYQALFNAAVESGNTAIMQKILARAITSKQAYRGTRGDLSLAMKGGHHEVMHMLLEAGATSRGGSMSGGDTFFSADTNEHDLEMLHGFVAAGASGDDVDITLDHLSQPMIALLIQEYPQSPKLTSTYRKILRNLLLNCIKTETVDFFKEVCQSIYVDSYQINDCLQLVVELGHQKLIRYFLEQGGNPFDARVLQTAVLRRPYILRLLFQKENWRQSVPKCVGARVLEPIMGNNPGDAEALQELVRTDAINFVRLENLQHHTLRRNASNEEICRANAAYTPLGLAIHGTTSGTNMFALRRFLEAGADPNGISKSNIELSGHPALMTALMVAVEAGREDAVNLLLMFGAEVNDRPRIRITRTALQYAAELGNADMVRLLVSHGADVNSSAAPYGGATASQFAAMSGNCNIIAELLHHGARLDALPSKVDGIWPLEGAAARGRLNNIPGLEFDHPLIPTAPHPRLHIYMSVPTPYKNNHNIIREFFLTIKLFPRIIYIIIKLYKKKGFIIPLY